MTSQISVLYPVKLFVGPAQEQELEAYPLGSPTGNSQLNNSFFHVDSIPKIRNDRAYTKEEICNLSN